MCLQHNWIMQQPSKLSIQGPSPCRHTKLIKIMAEFDENEIDILLKFLSQWGIRNQFNFILPKSDETELDFININLKTRSIFVDELNIDKEIIDIMGYTKKE